MIFQKKYSLYFYISLTLIVLYGLFALYVLVSSEWGQVVIPDDAFGAALGRRVLIARVIGGRLTVVWFCDVTLLSPDIW